MRLWAEFILAALLLSWMGCASAPAKLSSKTVVTEKGYVAQSLDAFHLAAAQADAATYLGCLAPNAIFVGTDATEHWDKKAFSDYVNRHFRRGKGWKINVTWRRVFLSKTGHVAWFEEKLRHARYGPLRGSGVMEKHKGHWKVAQYVLSFPIPNAKAKAVIVLTHTKKGH
jgi:hypothetical protein